MSGRLAPLLLYGLAREGKIWQNKKYVGLKEEEKIMVLIWAVAMLVTAVIPVVMGLRQYTRG